MCYKRVLYFVCLFYLVFLLLYLRLLLLVWTTQWNKNNRVSGCVIDLIASDRLLTICCDCFFADCIHMAQPMVVEGRWVRNRWEKRKQPVGSRSCGEKNLRRNDSAGCAWWAKTECSRVVNHAHCSLSFLFLFSLYISHPFIFLLLTNRWERNIYISLRFFGVFFLSFQSFRRSSPSCWRPALRRLPPRKLTRAGPSRWSAARCCRRGGCWNWSTEVGVAAAESMKREPAIGSQIRPVRPSEFQKRRENDYFLFSMVVKWPIGPAVAEKKREILIGVGSGWPIPL